MKILYVLDKPDLYGSERHVQKLIESFSAIHSIELLSFQDGPLLDAVNANNRIIPFSWFDLLNLYKWRKLVQLLNSTQFQLIHAHQPKAIFVMSILGWLLNIKTIITIHSLPITNAQSHQNRFVGLFVWLGHQFIKFISEQFASKIIYLSEFSFKTSFSPRKSVVIPNWISSDANVRESKSFTYGAKIKFITVGTISYNKGFDRLLHQLSTYSNNNWELHVVGGVDSGFQSKLDEMLSNLELKNKIIFHGFQNEVSSYFKASDIFIMLSRAETFGLVYIEAMSYGLPIIAWDIPVVHEILPKGNLILSSKINLESVLDSLISSPHDFNRVSQKNLHFVQAHFLEKPIIATYQKLYNQFT
ncbi:glycosyltransferase family 4 protein [Aquirufa regiilacus]